MRECINLDRWLETFHLVDGAISTELFRRGCPQQVAPEQWALSHTGALIQTHHDYLAAGAEALMAATFGANLFNPLAEFSEATLAEALDVLVGLARESAGEHVLVAASVGPLGLFADSNPGSSELKEHYRRHLEILRETECDLIAFETFTSIKEAMIALEQAHSLQLPCLISFATDDSGGLEDGDSLRHWVDHINQSEALAVGCNCSPDITAAVQVARRMRELTELPLIMRPNAGQPDSAGNYPVTAPAFAKHAVALFEAGVDIIGGCCGTSPEYIAAVAEALREHGEHGDDSGADLSGPDAIS
jgi:5-methyltetrahydrofolate--homocysteine methyltransferase